MDMLDLHRRMNKQLCELGVEININCIKTKWNFAPGAFRFVFGVRQALRGELKSPAPLVAGHRLVPVSLGHSDLVMNWLPWGLAAWSLAAVLSPVLVALGLGGPWLPCGPSDTLGSLCGPRTSCDAFTLVVLLALPTVAGSFWHRHAQKKRNCSTY